MSPPFFNFNRRLPTLRTFAELAQLNPAAPESDAASLEVQRGIGLSSFTSQAQAESNDLPVLLNIDILRGQARDGNTAAYATALNFYALQVQEANDPQGREEIRRQALDWGEEALQALVAAPGFERDRVRNLYDCVLALGSILAREGRDEIPASDQGLLLRYFVQIRAGIERHRLDRLQHPEYSPIPDYFDSYARAEQALLEGNAPEALAAFLETRRSIQSLGGNGAFRSRVLNGAEYAILAMQQDSSGPLLENLRSRWNLDLLARFDQIDGGTPAETQSLSLVALAAAETEMRGASARGLLNYLQGLPRYNAEERGRLLDLLQRLYAERPEFRQACDAQFHPAAGTTPQAMAETLLQNAATTASRILARQNQTPYATVLSQDRANRPLFEAVEQLRAAPELTEAIRTLLELPRAEPRTLAQNLIEYGPLAEVMLQSLPGSIRSGEAYRHFSQAILATASAGTAEGRRLRLEQPLEELLNAVGALSRDEERYAPAYENFFRSLAESSEEIAPGIQIPSALRRHAGELSASLTDFNGRRLARHLLSADSLLSLAGGIALTELLPIGILRYARNSGFWMRSGRLTWQSELAVGLGVGVAMSTVGGVHHLATSPRPWREELPRILPALALNTLLSSAAMGGTMLSGRMGRAMFLEQERSFPLVAQHLGVRLWTTGTGGLLQLGAGALGQGILTGRWETPNRETAAETFLNMFLWDLGAAGLRRIGNRFWWRAQLGPHTSGRIRDLAEAMMTRNRWLAQSPEERSGLENYLGRRQASREGLQEIVDGMGQNLEPYWNEGRIAFRRPSPSLRGQGPDAVVTPDEAAPVEQRVSDEVYNVSLETLQRLWNLPMRALPREILSSPILRPLHRVQVGPHEFFLSRILESESETGTRRRYALALVPVEVEGRAVLKRRFFYTSNSDAGAWRCSPFALGDGHLMKGVGRHYTQETQPVWEINEALHRLENEGPLPYVIPEAEFQRYISISSEALGEEGVGTMALGFTEEVEFPRVVGITQLGKIQPGDAFALPRGWGWGEQADVQQTLQDMRNLAWPEGFIPDFNQGPSRQLVQDHSLLGRVTFREYRGGYARDRESGRNRPLVWVMGEDSQGRAWVRHLYFADSPPNSYGVHSEIINSGILTSKPLEYFEQAGLLDAPYVRPFNGEYVDMSPALTLLEPIRQYRAARGLGLLLTEANIPTTRDRPNQE